MPDLAVHLRPEPASIPEARRAVERLTGAIPDELVDDLRLLVSEVVTNSVRHANLAASDLIDLRILVDRARVRVEVHDAGSGFQRPDGRRTLYQDSGWGLYLVDQLADRWGITSDEGTTVWFEIDR